MVMIVEDGTKVAGANSYISVAEADVYMSTYHPEDGWDGLDAEKDTLLILSTRSLDLLYGRYFKSVKETGSILLFPRYTFYDNDNTLVSGTIPQVLKDALCEIALIKYNSGNIMPLPNTSSDDESSSIKIGPISISSSGGSTNVNEEKYVGFYEIEQLLRSILKQSNSVTNIVR